MRVADKMAYDQVNRSIAKNRTEMAQLQNQAATQKRVTKPSDDPVAASRVLFSRIENRGTDQYIKNLNYAKSYLEFSEQSLSELNEVIVRAKELAISQANDASASSQTRKVVAQELGQLHDQAIQIGNRKLGERFIFGGYKTTAAPFANNGEYVGDKGEIQIHIDKESFLSMNMPGSFVFKGEGLSKDGFNHKTEPQARTTQELIQQQAANDMMAEPQAQSQETSMRGPASLRTTENVSPKTASINASTESKNLFPDGVDIFGTLKDLQTSLLADDKAGVQESIDKVDDALQQVILARSTLGARVMVINNTLNSMHTNIVDSKATISQLEDADAFEVISNINKNEGALQATLQTSGKLLQKSLMDFIS